MKTSFFRRARAARLSKDEGGVAAVELALIAPVLILLLGLAAALGEALAISQKVTATARTITDLVTRNPTLASSDLTTILNAAAATMTPYSTSVLSLTVSEVYVDGSGNATVVWSQSAYQGSALVTGSPVTLPAGSFQNSSYYILGAVSYAFTPFIVGSNVLGPITIADKMLWAPRESQQITLD